MNTVPSTYCPLFFETIHRAEERFVETGDETGRVIGVEEGLSGSVNIGGIAFVASACTVFTIIQKYDSLWSINSWRTAFRQLAVEVSVTGVKTVFSASRPYLRMESS